MSRFKKIVINIIVLAALFFLFIITSGLYLSPLLAHEHSERSIHYGPSDVIHIEDFDDGKYILCKYDKWVSCDTVNRKLYFFWRFGNQPIGFENNKTKVIDYNWYSSGQNYKVYGIINDDRVNRIQVTLNNGGIYTQTEFYDNLFLLTWRLDNEDCCLKNIRGYDSNNNIIFEDDLK